ncbi:hypothetical protein KQ247_00495 [Ruegeria pomeroyi]|nr:hypothetical protein [Ruegeria pomeroyi]NVK97173.1 hypothetical protein [Ruegeria pomeroyi]NVL03279.1 hypothetical protein [Ruegeria pomeroyi]QWV09148.1 hypothetical protein KQ247_00495 [Ruegeria pomeroyi]HCE70814.1 hypothetical protein [Ruegeria sp.]
MRRFALILAAVPTWAVADGFMPLAGDEIRAALVGRVLVYEGGARQSFDASGGTVYVTDRPSLGQWSLRGDLYCSLWPPSDLWACYTVASDGDRVRFVGQGGDITDGTYAE